MESALRSVIGPVRAWCFSSSRTQEEGSWPPSSPARERQRRAARMNRSRCSRLKRSRIVREELRVAEGRTPAELVVAVDELHRQRRGERPEQNRQRGALPSHPHRRCVLHAALQDHLGDAPGRRRVVGVPVARRAEHTPPARTGWDERRMARGDYVNESLERDTSSASALQVRDDR